jgi:hypothetical protein
MKTIRCCALFAVALALVAGASTGAGARARHFNAKTTAKFTDDEPLLGIPILPDPADTFTGQISTEKAKCLEGRTVKVFRGAVDGEVVGKGTTDKDGKWSIEAEDPGAGEYIAQVIRRNVSGDKQDGKGLRQMCASAKAGVTAEDS